MNLNELPKPEIQVTSINYKGANFQLLRLDQIHPLISGNKYFKLKHNIKACLQAGKNTILTFGGAYSNHIHATAYAAKLVGIKSIGIIRGEQMQVLNPTLQDAADWGMELAYADRAEYRNKTSADFLENLAEQFGDFYLIPEGGDNELGRTGCEEIVEYFPASCKHIVCAAGTGTTAAGIISRSKIDQKIYVVSALKGDFLKQEIALKLTNQTAEWELLDQFHFGGYAKWDPSLLDFIQSFKEESGVLLDPVYTAKTAFASVQLINEGYLPNDGSVLMIHTGGLQGVRGFNQRFGNLIHL